METMQEIRERRKLIHTLKCNELFYNCNDSTDEARHCCDLNKDHQGDHHCNCGLWSNC